MYFYVSIVYNNHKYLPEWGGNMHENDYMALCEMAAEPQMNARTIAYVHQHISAFLKKKERVLICFENSPNSFGAVLEEAVLRCDAVPVFPEDLRWKTLLRTSFFNHCAAVVGTPLLVLGLAKLAKRMETPLYFRNVLLAGYPTVGWMIDGIRQGLDCRLFGCFDPCVGPVIAGFSCPETPAIHVRSDEYAVEIVDEQGNAVPENERGEIVLYPVSDPQLRFHTGDFGRLDRSHCSCGCKSPRIMDFDTVRHVDQELSQLGAKLHMWTSILDCRLSRTEFGLELEIVTFPGEKLPKLPSCAKLVVRNWNPETDIPFPHMFNLKNRHFSEDNG